MRSVVSFAQTQRDFAQREQITDVEATASIADFIALRPGMTPDRFWAAFGRVLAGSTPQQPRAGINRPPLVPKFGQYGFRPEFLEAVERHGLHGNNQVRHFVAYAVYGYARGGFLGYVGNWTRESGGDYALGVLGVDLGTASRDGALSITEIGDWIRIRAGE